MQEIQDDRKMRTPEAAAYAGCSPRTMEKLRQTGGGAIFLKIGRAVLYEKSALDRWLKQCQRKSTSDPGGTVDAVR